VRTSLRVRLLGTMVAVPNELSLATIEDQVTRDGSTWMVGDMIQGARILEIQRERVIILANGRREFIDGTAGAGAPVAAIPAPQKPTASARKAPKGPELGSSIRATGENTYEVPRAEIDKTLSNLNSLAMKARIVPAFKDGKATGFKLFSIRPNSLYSKIGVQNGDVIKRINGYDLNSPEKALEVYTKLKEATRIDLELERRGKTVRKTYNIR
jgi:general secretion pathway protein C